MASDSSTSSTSGDSVSRATATPVVGLNQKLKDEIQGAYRHWLEARGFQPRRGQREMIAHVARALTGERPRMVVVEAGTGTGKTAGYSLAAIPVARATGKTVVVATATVALQEQVTLHDVPDLKQNAGLQFSVALAKGRGRYVCLKRLDDHLKYQGQQEMALSFSADVDLSDTARVALYQSMLEAFARGEWDGELDTWPDELPDGAWPPLTTDHRGCSNNRCSFFKQCPFFKARGALEGVDVIVANHDLVLADLALGGGAVLPEPEDCIFVLDEAHHIADKTQNHFSSRARMYGTIMWLEQVNNTLGTLTQRFGRPHELVSISTDVAAETASLQMALEGLLEGLTGLDFEPREEGLDIHRFPHGAVPEHVAELAATACSPLEMMCARLDSTHELLQEVLAGERTWQNGFEAEDWLLPVGQLHSRATATLALLQNYAQESPHRYARWVNRTDTEMEVVSAPIEPGHILQEVLWERAYGAICTSATLTAAGDFSRFVERSGLSRDITRARISSPFNYPEIATFRVPPMNSDPRDFDAHSEEVAQLLPELLTQEISALVLFTSWRQLNAVMKLLPENVSEKLLVQGEGSKQALIRTHRERIDAGEASQLVGLASFSEGLDLPDAYCRHVIIVKLPFAVPDDPVDQAIAEWAEQRGRNAFYEISVPDAALKLIQACGRLIRHENDWGTITMLDKRVVTQRYGRVLLQSLPPFRMDLPGAQ